MDNPGKVISVPTALVNEVMSCFEDMAASWVEVSRRGVCVCVCVCVCVILLGGCVML